jgi:CRISPR/Cas system endoribonuclease Cas6 (RAMP superfamily)
MGACGHDTFRLAMGLLRGWTGRIRFRLFGIIDYGSDSAMVRAYVRR